MRTLSHEHKPEFCYALVDFSKLILKASLHTGKYCHESLPAILCTCIAFNIDSAS
jgi:hypothetical protein